MNLANRSHHKELLDNDSIPFGDIKQNMRELDFINSQLGGHRATIYGLKKLIGKRRKIHVCEIGCGGGDNLYTLQKWCHRNNIQATFTGIDIKQFCIDFAKEKFSLLENVTWIVNDYQQIKFESKPDVVFSSLFCHHFTNKALVTQLQWMKENSNIGFFINDLQRHWLAYYSIKLLTKLFSASYLVKNDAPLSVARGFKKNEWRNIISKATIETCQIYWKWAFRYLIVCVNPDLI